MTDFPASGLSYSAIQNAINQAHALSGHNRVILPAGSGILNPSSDGVLRSYGNIDIIGPGQDLCVLKGTIVPPYYDDPNSLGAGFLSVNGASENGASVILKGFSYIGFRELYPDNGAHLNGIWIQQIKDFLIQDVKIKDIGGNGIQTMGWYDSGSLVTQGVISRCSLINTSGVPGGAGGASTGPNVLGYGICAYGSRGLGWVPDSMQVLGKYNYGRSCIYVEDSYFSHWRHDIASANNAHYVFRHNIIEFDSGFHCIDAHGYQGGTDIGTRAVEVYNNILRSPTRTGTWNGEGVSWGGQIRGGAATIFNNTLQGYTGFMLFMNEGTNSLYYPTDVWMWNNTLNGATLYALDTTAPTNFNLTAPTNYTPYAYPHPLAGVITPAKPVLNINSSPSGIPFTVRRIS